MGAIGRKSVATVAAALAIAAPAYAQDECAAFRARFEAALTVPDFRGAIAVENEIALSGACGNERNPLRAKRAGRQIESAEALKKSPAHQKEREALLFQADEPGLLWTAAYAIGELHMEKKRYKEAVQAFERSITLAGGNKTNPVSPAIIEDLVKASYEARAFADGYVSVAHNTRGGVGGSLDRGIPVRKVPLPIQFETDRDELTPVGRQYADELAAAINEQRPAVIILEGHTDERGTDAHNMDLSKRRVERVAAYLKREKGVAARIETRARGKTEPYVPQNASNLTNEQLWELNRRVVWQRN
ncbi:OmpA/MotB domain protein [Rhodomicrobium vannielii ATCC 17100]|uniref:OmpA/MotB domain protein n=1 Tax=Rhodomicrobium vannielii (strain ATCC 17100 / DSM 162 / LMG 4299 / NCIMB 10020 / ATH 3.1.1) TaxID=648757 RepID=E3I570_RHOVT|nr:OmpA family protein [Rhodomicrobium vannielii]ADP70520.1 OmpA/MotB domain protein [Rhodomicrobium vannielii ATCC 17100]